MRVRLLGPVDVLVDGVAVSVAGLRRRAVLATLALRPGEVLTGERIVAAVWGGAPPPTGFTTLQTHVSHLRRILGTGATIHSRRPGYLFEPGPGSVDVQLAQDLIERGMRAVDDPGERVRQLGSALALWRGPSLADVRRVPYLAEEAQRLDELRSRVERLLLEARLGLGEHGLLVPDLERLSQDSPYDEQVHGLLVLALYRCGRADEALAVYRRLRDVLDRELGLQPGQALRDLEAAVLRRDRTLDHRAAASAPPVEGKVPMQLPAGLARFVGRGRELAQLDALVPAGATAVVITAVSGTAGIGKTTLAVHWAHRVAARFPDGQLYVNLRGFAPEGSVVSPAEAVRRFLDALGVPAERVPVGLAAQTALYRSRLAGRRVLVLLDNARDAEQVRPLLPGSPGCLVLVTSRGQLSPLVSAEGAHPLTLELPSAAEAAELLASRLGAHRVAGQPEAVARIIERCARLPLALAIAAARAAANPLLPLTTTATSLGSATADLGVFDAGDPSTDVRSVFSWSYRALSPKAARLFRLLGLHPGPDTSTAAAASLAGVPLPRARRLLAELTGAHLIAEPTPDRYGFHDLLRAYAGELTHELDSQTERHAATRRLLDHYLHTTDVALKHSTHLGDRRITLPLPEPDPAATISRTVDADPAVGWFATEHSTLLACVDLAVAAGFDAHVWHLARGMLLYLRNAAHWMELIATQRAALGAATRLGDRNAEAASRSWLGLASVRLGRAADAREYLSSAARLFEEVDDPFGHADCLFTQALLADGEGRYDELLGHALAAVAVAERAGLPRLQALALNNVGWAYVRLGDYQQTFEFCTKAIALQEGFGDHAGAALSWDSIGYAHYQLGNHAEAIAAYERALAPPASRDADWFMTAGTLSNLGDAYLAVGNHEGARGAWERALAILDSLDVPDAAKVRDKLNGLAG